MCLRGEQLEREHGNQRICRRGQDKLKQAAKECGGGGKAESRWQFERFRGRPRRCQGGDKRKSGELMKDEWAWGKEGSIWGGQVAGATVLASDRLLGA